MLRAAENITMEQLAELKECNDRLLGILEELKSEKRTNLDPERGDLWKATDAKFHITILRAAGNRLSLKTVSDLRVMTQVFGLSNEFVSMEILERTCREHQMMIDAHCQARWRTSTPGPHSTLATGMRANAKGV